MRLNDYFDKIFIINLERRPDRLESVIRNSKFYEFEFELFYAIDGKSINKDSLINDERIEIKNSDFYNEINSYFLGQLGCILSHLSILKYCKENNIKSVLILEDDVEFAENFNDKFTKFTEVFDKEWDMIYFSGSLINTSDVYETYHKLNSCHTTHSYAVNSTVYDHIIDKLETYKFSKPVDVIYSEIQSSMKSWITMPFLTYQSTSFSDIQEKVVDYDSIKKNL